MNECSLEWVIQDMEHWVDENPRTDEWKMREWVGKLKKMQWRHTAVLINGLVEAAYTHKGYPNASPEGTAARRALSAYGLTDMEQEDIWDSLHPRNAECD